MLMELECSSVSPKLARRFTVSLIGSSGKQTFRTSERATHGVWSLAAFVIVTATLHGRQPQPEARGIAADRIPRRVDHHGESLPDGAIARRGVLRFQHGNEIASLAFSPNGKMLASAGDDPSVRLWDLATGKELHRLERRGQAPELVAFSHSGDMLASASRDGISLWDLRQNIQLWSFTGHRLWITSVVFTPSDEKIISAGCDGTIRVWDVASGKELLRLPNPRGPNTVLALSQDGNLLASGGGDKLVRLWDLTTGKPLHVLEGHITEPRFVAFAPDRKRLVSTDKDMVIWWSIDRGTEIRRFTDIVDGEIVALSPDFKSLMVSYNARYTTLVDPATGLTRQTIDGHRFDRPIAFSPDGRTFAADEDENTSLSPRGIITIWDVATCKERLNPRHSQMPVLAGEILPAGEVLLATNGEIQLWDSLFSRKLRVFRGERAVGGELTISADRKLLAARTYDARKDGSRIALWGNEFAHLRKVGSRIAVWDTASANLIGEWDDDGFNFGLAFSPHEPLPLAGNHAGELREWNPSLREPVRQVGLKERKESQRLSGPCVFSRDGSLFAAASTGAAVHIMMKSRPPHEALTVWSTATGQPVRQVAVNKRLVGVIALSADGCAMAAATGRLAGYDSLIHVWELRSGKEYQWAPGRDVAVEAIAFSPDGKMLATGDSRKLVQLWEVETGSKRRVFSGHEKPVRFLSFSSDGKTLLSASDDMTAMLWDVTGRRIQQGSTARAAQTELISLWSDLSSVDGEQSYRALTRLMAVPEESVSLLKKELSPVPSEKSLVPRLVTDLGSDRFAERDGAMRRLDVLAEGAEPELRAALSNARSPDLRRRLERLVSNLEPSTSPRLLRAIRAVELLEHIGSPAALEFLRDLAKGASEARLTREAKAAVERLAKAANR
jgi:WD40 repeat protein